MVRFVGNSGGIRGSGDASHLQNAAQETRTTPERPRNPIPIPPDLPTHLPKLEGKPSIIQEAAWKGAEALAQRYYARQTPGGNRAADADASTVLSFIATAMRAKPDLVLDGATRKLLAAGFRSMGLPAPKIESMVDSLAEAVAARLGYRPPLSGKRMDDVHEAIEILRRSELESLFLLVGRDPREAAKVIARLIDRLLGRVVSFDDEDEDEEGHEAAEESHPEGDDSEAESGGSDSSGGTGGSGEAEGSEAHNPKSPRSNVGASLARLHAVAPDHTPAIYRAVLDFATTLAEMVGLETDSDLQ